MQQCVYNTKQRFVTSVTCKKRLMQTWFDFDQNIIDAEVDQWRNRLRSCVHDGVGNFEHAKLLSICIMRFIRTF